MRHGAKQATYANVSTTISVKIGADWSERRQARTVFNFK